MAELSEKKRKAIEAEEFIRFEARQKAALKSKWTLIPLILVFVIFGGALWLINRNENSLSWRLVALENEVRSCLDSLGDIEKNDKLYLDGKMGAHVYTPTFLHHPLLSDSISYGTFSLKSLSPQFRSDLILKAIKVEEADSHLKQLSDQGKSTSEQAWRQALQEELESIHAYKIAATTLLEALEKEIQKHPELNELRIKNGK